MIVNRSGFIKSILTLVAAPTLIGEIKFTESITKQYYFRITEEMMNDKGYMDYILKDNQSELYINASKNYGIDFEKDFKVEVGHKWNQATAKNNLIISISQDA